MIQFLSNKYPLKVFSKHTNSTFLNLNDKLYSKFKFITLFRKQFITVTNSIGLIFIHVILSSNLLKCLYH